MRDIKKDKKIWAVYVMYYVFFVFIYWGLFVIFGSVSETEEPSFGHAAVRIYGWFFVATPAIIVIISRFSLFKWYVDPIVAVVITLSVYVSMIYTEINEYGNDIFDAIIDINKNLSSNGGEGWKVGVIFYSFCLIATFSIARKRGESISFRLIDIAKRKSNIVETKCVNKVMD